MEEWETINKLVLAYLLAYLRSKIIFYSSNHPPLSSAVEYEIASPVCARLLNLNSKWNGFGSVSLRQLLLFPFILNRVNQERSATHRSGPSQEREEEKENVPTWSAHGTPHASKHQDGDQFNESKTHRTANSNSTSA
jgi:hypothetical protein